MKSGIKSLAACLAVVAVLGMASESFGQVVGFNGNGKKAVYTNPLSPENSVPEAGWYSGVGTVSHMGKVDLVGQVLFAGEPEGNVYPVAFTEGTLFATDQDGDRIEFGVVPGSNPTVTLVPAGDLFTAAWTVQMKVIGGTGKYEDVTSGPLDVSAVNEPFNLSDPTLIYSWKIKGKIDLGKKGKK